MTFSRRATMRRQTLTDIAVLLLAVATFLMATDVMTIRKQQAQQLTRQDVREIVDSVLIEIYD